MEVMDASSEVMPPLLRHNKGLERGLSHTGGCRGCGEASSQQPDAPKTLLRTFHPSIHRRMSAKRMRKGEQRRTEGASIVK